MASCTRATQQVYNRDGAPQVSGPLITIVMPCFNVAATVAETVESVRRQTLQDFELLAIDNNSTDATGAILESLARGFARMRVIRHPVQGLSAARNAGIRQARGRFVALVDADDVWDAGYLEAHMTNFAGPDIGVSYSRIRHVDWAGYPTGKSTRPKLAGLTAADLLISNPCTSLVVARREVFETAGLFDERLRRVEDQEWLFRVLITGCKLEGLDRVLASYRLSPGGLSANTGAMLESHGQMLEIAEAIAPSLVRRHRRVARATMLRYCSRRSMDHGDGAAARAYLLRMLREAPDLVLRQPQATLSVIVEILTPGLGEWLRRQRLPVQAKAE